MPKVNFSGIVTAMFGLFFIALAFLIHATGWECTPTAWLSPPWSSALWVPMQSSVLRDEGYRSCHASARYHY